MGRYGGRRPWDGQAGVSRFRAYVFVAISLLAVAIFVYTNSLIRRLETQEVPVRARLPPSSVIPPRPFAEAQGYPEGSLALDEPDECGNSFRMVFGILAGLQHHGAIPRTCGVTSGFQNVLVRHPGPPLVAVCRPQPTVGTVPNTAIGKLQKSAEMHLVADKVAADPVGGTSECVKSLNVLLPQPRLDLIRRQPLPRAS